MSKTVLLSDEAEQAIVESFEHNMQEIMQCIGGPGYHLHDSIIEAISGAVERGVYRATKESIENNRGEK